MDEEKTGRFVRVGENLIRHRGSGMIYLQAKVAGRKGPLRVSLETPDLRVAKIARDARLEKLREAGAKAVAAGSRRMETLGDAIEVVAGRRVGAEHTKASTGKYNGELLEVLRETWPVAVVPRRFTEREARAWWKAMGQRFGVTRGNALLQMARQVMAAAMAEGLLREDPLADLELRKGKKKVRLLPTRRQLEMIVREMEVSLKRKSLQGALFVEFLAASGCRPEEARAVALVDFLTQDKWLRVTGNETGTKTHSERLVPVNPRLKAVVDRIRELVTAEDREKAGEEFAGRLFTIKTPAAALRNACQRLGLPHLTLYDMRHYFNTWAIESGVPIPTVAKWIGHKDGGALLMRTYTHLRDAHSLEEAGKLK